MPNFLRKILQHKFLSIIAIIILCAAVYFGYKKWFVAPAETRYVLAAVEKGTLIVSVSGSGQVSASNQVDLKSKVSGDAVSVVVKNGQEVKTGALLAQIDSRAAQKTARDAETALETAKLELAKMLSPADELTVLQAENSLIQAKDTLTKLKFTQENDYQNALDAKQKVEEDLKKAYEDGFNKVSGAFLDLPTIITGLNSLCFTNTIEKLQWNADWYANQVITYDDVKVPKYKKDVYDAFQAARVKYNDNFANYKSANRNSDIATIEALIAETYETVKSVAEAIKAANNFLDLVKDLMQQHNASIPSTLTAYQSNFNSYTGTTNSQLSNLLSIKQTIEDDKKAIHDAEQNLKEMDQNNPLNLAAAERTVKEKEESLVDTKAAPDELDIRAKKIAVQQKEDALLDARQNLADYSIRAPFDGVITTVNVKKGDSVSGGAAIATLITKQKIAEISLNEIDIAKVKIGQKATLTFDAVEGLSITGEVIELDTLGAVTQGVVTYKVKIGCDTQDERVKPSMSVSVAIITEAKSDALMAPNAAVKSSGDVYYVEMLNETASAQSMTDPNGVIAQTPPRRQSVEIGLANDSMTEILSGLKLGDAVVTRTITSATASSQTQQRNVLQQLQGGGPGGQMRIR